MLRYLLLVTTLLSPLVFADNLPLRPVQGEYIDIYAQSEDDIKLILDTLNQRADLQTSEPVPPIVMLLHGPEAMRFLRSYYSENMSLVDSAAKLSAYGLLDVRICETWMRRNKHGQDELFPFIDTVPFVPREIKRLEKEEEFAEFSVDL